MCKPSIFFALCIIYSVSCSVEDIPSRSFIDYELIRVNATQKFAQDLKITFEDAEEKLDIWKETRSKGFVLMDILVSPHQSKLMKSLNKHCNGVTFKVLQKNISKLIREEEENDKFDETDLEGRPIQDIRWNKYYDVEVMYDYLEKLQITYPFKDFIKVEEIGKSTEGRPIKMAKIHNFTRSSNTNKKRVFIDGGVHAREWISPAVALYFIYLLVERHEDNRQLVNNYEWLIVPMINPDGYKHSRKSNRMWRKSRRNNGKGQCYGVDLNRNFGFHWKEGLNNKALSDPCSEIYAGPSSFSEPETKAIQQTILNYNRTVVAYFSLHSYSQLWAFPWSYKLPDRESSKYYDLYHAAKKAVESLKSQHGTNYVFGSSSELSYQSSGTSDDWMYGVAGIKYSFTIELRDEGKYGFLLPSSQVVPTAEETFAGISALLTDICD